MLRTRSIPLKCVIYINDKPVTQRPIWLIEEGLYELKVYDTSNNRWVGGEKPIVVQNFPQGFGAEMDGIKIGPLEQRRRYICRKVEWEGI